MRTITYKSISIVLCLALSLGTLSFGLAYPKRAHAILPILGGAAAAAGLSDAAVIGAFAAFAAACGFSIAAAVGADSSAPVASWTDEQLDRAGQILQGWMDRADQTLGSVELGRILQASPEPPEDPNDDDDDDDIPEVEGEKVQPQKSDADNPIDYMLAMLAVNGSIGLTGGFADLIGSFVDYATVPESEGGAGFVGNLVYPDSVTDPVNGWTFRVDDSITPAEYGISTSGPPSGYVCDVLVYSDFMKAFPTSSSPVSIGEINTSYMSFFVDFGVSTCAVGYRNFWDDSYSSRGSYVYAVGSRSFPAGSVVSPRVAHMINNSFTSIGGGIINAIQDGNSAIVSALQQMASDQAAAIATLQDYYANDVSSSPAGTNQYVTVQSPYYVSSGSTDPQTGAYTANIVANDYNHGAISQYDDAVATNTSSPQPGNTGYQPGNYDGNSSSDIPPWQPLTEIHLDKVWPFSLIGDSYSTFDDIFSMDGGSEWDWHIVIPLKSWNLAIGGAEIFDDYDLDLSIWRDLFLYLAPWFLLFVFLALLDMARRLWLRWNASGDGD